MPNWGAILAGLGKGATVAGESLDTKRLLAAQQQRQRAMDALAELGTFDTLGATDVSGQADPLGALRLKQMEGLDPSASITGGPSLSAQRDQQRSYGDARTIQLPGPDGRMRTILLDPSQGKDARTEQRQLALVQAKGAEPYNLPAGAARFGGNNRLLASNPKPEEIETFGTPYAAVQGGKPGMFERGNRGTVRPIQGQTPYQAPQAEQPLERIETPQGPRFVTRAQALGQRPALAGDGKGPGATAQGVQARLLGAVSEARAAIPRMTAMEQKWLDDPSTIPNGLGSALAKMGTRFSGAHTASGIAMEGMGESFADPEVLQYMRDAALMARATQLMSSRGGSEAMVNSEQLLNRAVPRSEGLKQSVSAAQKSRNAIFGPMGGLMQALTPEQIAKVEAGLKALDAGDQNGAMIVGSVFDEARAAQPAPGAGGRSNTPTRRAGDAKQMSQHTFDALSKAEQAEARAAGYTIRPR